MSATPTTLARIRQLQQREAKLVARLTLIAEALDAIDEDSTEQQMRDTIALCNKHITATQEQAQ